MTKHLLTLGLFLGLMTTGCTTDAPPPVQVAALPAQSFSQQWKADIELQKRESVDRLFLRNNTLFAYTTGYRIFALDRSNGILQFGTQPIAPRTRPSPLNGDEYDPTEFYHFFANPSDRLPTLRAPVVLPEFVVIPTTSTLELFDHRGRFVRTVHLDFAIRAGAVGANQVVYVAADAANGGRVIAVDLRSSEVGALLKRWELLTPDRGIAATPAILERELFIGSENGVLYAVNADDRSPLWAETSSFRTAGPIVADVKADNLGVYVASRDTKLYCLDPATGKLRWTYFASVPLTTSPAVTDNTVYQYVRGQGLVAIDKVEGDRIRKPRWIAKDALKLVAEDRQYAYVRYRDNSIVAIDITTGEAKFRSRRTDFTAFATNTNDGTIYAATRTGQILAIAPILKGGVTGELVLEARPLNMLAMND